MKKLNIAIIGQGRSGRDIHGAFFRSEANTLYHVAAIVDELPERRERARAEYGPDVDVYASHKELYGRKDIDLVVNSTYSYQHYPVAMDLLTHGFNVVVEKPFCMRVCEAEAMIRAAKEHGVMLCVFQQSHFAPYYRRIREILASGVLGDIQQISIHFSGFARRWDWQTSQRFGGGGMRNTGPHPLEQALDLLDVDELPAVTSRMACVNTFGDADDYCKILLLAPGKPVMDVEISSCDAYNDYNYNIQGSRGCLRATLSHIQYKYYRPEDEAERALTLEPLCDKNGYPAYCSEQLTWHQFEEDVQGTAFDSAVKLYYDNIYAHLTQGEPLVIRPEKIALQVALFEEVFRQNPMPIRF